MRQVLCVIMTLALLPSFAAADTAAVTAQIAGMPFGARIEIRLKNAQKMRGTRGAVSETGLLLVDARASERQIAFVDIASVKQLTHGSHLKRNIWIAVGVSVAVAVTIAIAYGLALAKLGHST